MHTCVYCTARTDGAAEMECSQCTHGARCVTGPSSAAVVPADEAEQLGNSVLLPNSQNREEEDNEPRIHCNCQHYKCTGLASNKFCATNGVTYNNECYMWKEACLRQTSIHKLYDGHCRLHCKLVTLLFLSLSLSLRPQETDLVDSVLELSTCFLLGTI